MHVHLPSTFVTRASQYYVRLPRTFVTRAEYYIYD